MKKIKTAETFVGEMYDLIATLSEDQITEYRQKAITLFTEEKKSEEKMNKCSSTLK